MLVLDEPVASFLPLGCKRQFSGGVRYCVAINDSFLARVQVLIWHSRRSAALSEAHGSVYTSTTGRRDAVYLAPLPELWTRRRSSGSRANPVYRLPSAQRTM